MGKQIYRIIAFVICMGIFVVMLAGCGNVDKPAEVQPTVSALITASPDGTVTAGPTLPAATDSADNTPEGSAPADNTPAGGEHAFNTPNASEPVTTPSSTGAAGTSAPSAAPTSIPTATPAGMTPTPVPAVTPIPTAAPSPTAPHTNSFAAHYEGASVDCSSLSVGDVFFWTFDITNTGSGMYSGHWLLDYPEAFVTPLAYSVGWSGGLIYAIQQTIDDECATSDLPAFVCNMVYEGATGQFPQGEAGNYYHNVGMYLTSFSHMGVQAAGSIIRIKYQIDVIPSRALMQHDSDGYYIELPIVVVESTYMYINSAGQMAGATHGIITATSGKIYF